MRRGFCVALVLLVAACIAIPVGSRVSIDDGLPDALPLEAGECVTVCGEDGSPTDCPVTSIYFSGGCKCVFRPNLIGETAKLLLEADPAPGAFAVRPFDELAPEPSSGEADDGSGVGLFGISTAKAVALRVRYVIWVKERRDSSVYVPLYLVPFGIAVCGLETVLEARVYEASSGRLVGVDTVTAGGPYVLLAYMLHVLFHSDTQKDARCRVAEQIAAKLTRDRQ